MTYNHVRIHPDTRDRVYTPEIGEIYLLGTGLATTAYMVIGFPTGPDHDHMLYNLLNLSSGFCLYIKGFGSLKELQEAMDGHYARHHAGVTISQEKP